VLPPQKNIEKFPRNPIVMDSEKAVCHKSLIPELPSNHHRWLKAETLERNPFFNIR